MDKLLEIKRIYLHTTRRTVQRDLQRAIELLKSMETEEEREKAAVYMDGLAQMRAEWMEEESSHQPPATRHATGRSNGH